MAHRNSPLLALVVLTLGGAPGTLISQAPPAADAYVNSGAPTTNYGDKTTLDIQSARSSFITFDLSPFPAGASVAKATIRLFVTSVNTGGSFNVFPVTSAWTESSVTFNTQPSIGSLAAGPVAVASSAVNDFVLVDITGLVQSWVSASLPNNGLALVLVGSTGKFSFESKENAQPPELEVVLNGPAGPQGPMGPQGPTGPQGPPGPSGVSKTGDTMTGTLTLSPGNIDLAVDPSNGTGGSLLKGGVPFLHDGGSISNTFVGRFAGNLTMTGGSNTAAGYGSLGINVSGSSNTAMGIYALGNNNGNSNSAVGASALYSNSSGSGNTAMGVLALFSNSNGSNNTATGDGALGQNTTGSSNTANGVSSLVGNMTGSGNTAVGYNTSPNNTTGANNTAVGLNALLANTTGNGNVAVGSNAGSNLTTGNNNIDIANQGMAGDSATIRIGDQQMATYIAGIRNSTVTDPLTVVIDASGRLGASAGVTGPPGPAGPAGPPGPPGPAGASLQFVDANNLVVGPVIGVGDYGRASTVVPVGGDLVAFGVGVDGLGAIPGLPIGITQVSYASNDCSGQPYGPAGDTNPLIIAVVFGSTVFYVRPDAGQTITVLGIQRINSDGSLGGCQAPVPFQWQATPMVVMPVPTFAPPIRVVLE